MFEKMKNGGSEGGLGDLVSAAACETLFQVEEKKKIARGKARGLGRVGAKSQSSPPTDTPARVWTDLSVDAWSCRSFMRVFPVVSLILLWNWFTSDSTHSSVYFSASDTLSLLAWLLENDVFCVEEHNV